VLEKTKWVPERKRPTIAYKAPRGFEEVKLKGKGATYGLLKGCRSLKLKDIRGLIDKAAAAGPGGGGGGEDEAEGGDEEDGDDHEYEQASKTVSFEITPSTKRRLLDFAKHWGIRGNERTIDDGDGNKVKVKPYDINALPRMAANGDVVPGPAVHEAVKRLQDDIFSLRTQLDWERGEMGAWKQTFERFEAPRIGRGKGTKEQRASDRRAWRTLRAIEPHLHAIWCLCDTDESVEGFERAMAYLVERRGQPGARCAKGRQYFTKRFIALLHEGPLVKRRFEVERRKKHLLRAKRDALEYRGLWVPLGAEFEAETEATTPTTRRASGRRCARSTRR